MEGLDVKINLNRPTALRSDRVDETLFLLPLLLKLSLTLDPFSLSPSPPLLQHAIDPTRDVNPMSPIQQLSESTQLVRLYDNFSPVMSLVGAVPATSPMLFRTIIAVSTSSTLMFLLCRGLLLLHLPLLQECGGESILPSGNKR